MTQKTIYTRIKKDTNWGARKDLTGEPGRLLQKMIGKILALSIHVVQAKENPGNQTLPFWYIISYLQYLLCPAKSSKWGHNHSNLLCNYRKKKENHIRLPPEPWVAGNNPVSSRQNPLDSACSLNLHPIIEK